jgi:chloride channel protein, CIC family
VRPCFSHQDLEDILHDHQCLNDRSQRLYPIVDDEQHLKGVVTLKDLQQHLKGENATPQEGISDTQQSDGTEHSDTGGMVCVDTTQTLLHYVHTHPVVAYPDEPLRAVIDRMAKTGYTRLPVVERNNSRKLAGMISLHDLLKARGRSLEEEHHRERVLRLRLQFPTRRKEEIKQV